MTYNSEVTRKDFEEFVRLLDEVPEKKSKSKPTPGALDKIWHKMTPDEQTEYACLSLCGGMIYQPNGDVMILMGSAAFERKREYEREMLKKYDRFEIEYLGQRWVFEKVDPEPTRWQRFWNAITGTSVSSNITFQSPERPENRLVFSKKYFFEQFAWNNASIQFALE